MEQRLGKPLKSSHDFEALRAFMLAQTNEHLSTSTLRRIWTYTEGNTVPRESSLDLLSRCIGYRNWIDFETNHPINSDIESSAVTFAEHLSTKDIEPNEIIGLSWLPNRHILIQYCGEDLFKVVKSENSKLQEGNTFYCSLFILHEPLLISKLQQGIRTIDLFQLGKRGGLTEIKRHLGKKVK